VEYVDWESDFSLSLIEFEANHRGGNNPLASAHSLVVGPESGSDHRTGMYLPSSPAAAVPNSDSLDDLGREDCFDGPVLILPPQNFHPLGTRQRDD